MDLSSIRVVASALFLALPTALYGADGVKIPDEFEVTSGLGVATLNSGVGGTDSFTAITVNPAGVTKPKSYVVHGIYHWPTAGRDYYQLGVVDATMSPVSAGFSYSGSTEEYRYPVEGSADVSPYDSPVSRRVSLALAQEFESISVGIGGTYVEAKPSLDSLAYKQGEQRLAGVGLNIGLLGSVAPGWTVGASAQNLANKRISDFAPRTFRIGTAYQFSQIFTGNVDVRQRDRISGFETKSGVSGVPNERGMDKAERMVIVAGTFQIQDYLKLLGSYGSSLTDERSSLAGGVALSSKNFSLAYTASRPYLKYPTAHQAVTLNIEMAM